MDLGGLLHCDLFAISLSGSHEDKHQWAELYGDFKASPSTSGERLLSKQVEGFVDTSEKEARGTGLHFYFRFNYN